jgi:hypothetical protein
MAQRGCRLIMDSGQTLTLDIDPDEFIHAAQNKMGVLINGFLQFGDTYINPAHVSFILPLEEQ